MIYPKIGHSSQKTFGCTLALQRLCQGFARSLRILSSAACSVALSNIWVPRTFRSCWLWIYAATVSNLEAFKHSVIRLAFLPFSHFSGQTRDTLEASHIHLTDSSPAYIQYWKCGLTFALVGRWILTVSAESKRNCRFFCKIFEMRSPLAVVSIPSSLIPWKGVENSIFSPTTVSSSETLVGKETFL